MSRQSFSYIFLMVIVVCFSSLVIGQTDNLDNSLILYYDFNDCQAGSMTIKDKSPIASDGFLQNAISTCNSCGVDGAVRFQRDNYITSGEKTIPYLQRGNFAVAMLVNPLEADKNYLLFTRAPDCEEPNRIYVSYNPSIRTVRLNLTNVDGRVAQAEAVVPKGLCWFHLLVTKDNRIFRIYINGQLIEEKSIGSEFDLFETQSTFEIGGGSCAGDFAFDSYDGYMDELRVYDIRIGDQEAKLIYESINNLSGQIVEPANNPARVLQNDSLLLKINSACVESVSWSPAGNIDNPTSIDSTFFSGTENVTLMAEIKDDIGCTFEQELEVTVVDPSDLDCNEVLAPNAFTPNNDRLNDTFSILSQSVIDKFIQVDIYDSKSHLLFRSDRPDFKWDGTLDGKPLDSGVYYYKLRFECDNNPINFNGTVLLIK